MVSMLHSDINSEMVQQIHSPVPLSCLIRSGFHSLWNVVNEGKQDWSYRYRNLLRKSYSGN